MSEMSHDFAPGRDLPPSIKAMTQDELDRMRAEWEVLPYGSREQGEKKRTWIRMKFEFDRPAREAEARRVKERLAELDALPIRELLQLRLNQAPRLTGIPVRTMAELAESVGATLETMESAFQSRIAEYVTSVDDHSPQPEVEDLPFFGMLYELSRRARDPAERARLPWLEAFTSFASFQRHHLQDVSRRQVAMFRCQVMYATERCVHPERIVTAQPDAGRNAYHWSDREKFYQAAGTWALLPGKISEYKDEYAFVEMNVIDEVVGLIESGYRPSDYSHASGSAALWPIGRQGAIVSSGELFERNRAVRTGEARDDAFEKGLWNVYGDRGFQGWSAYNTIAWFDESFVTFGISQAKQEEHLRTVAPGSRKSSFGESLSLMHSGLVGEDDDHKIVDYGGDGNLLGPQVPLSSVDTIYAWKAAEESVRHWIARFAPHARFVSFEAHTALMGSGSFVNALAIQEGIEPVEAWRSLKDHAVVVS